MSDWPSEPFPPASSYDDPFPRRSRRPGQDQRPEPEPMPVEASEPAEPEPERQAGQRFAPNQPMNGAVIPGGIWFTPTDAQVALLVAAQISSTMSEIVEAATVFEDHLHQVASRRGR